jgi:hypothetical protein
VAHHGTSLNDGPQHTHIYIYVYCSLAYQQPFFVQASRDGAACNSRRPLPWSGSAPTQPARESPQTAAAYGGTGPWSRRRLPVTCSVARWTPPPCRSCAGNSIREECAGALGSWASHSSGQPSDMPLCLWCRKQSGGNFGFGGTRQATRRARRMDCCRSPCFFLSGPNLSAGTASDAQRV